MFGKRSLKIGVEWRCEHYTPLYTAARQITTLYTTGNSNVNYRYVKEILFFAKNGQNAPFFGGLEFGVPMSPETQKNIHG